MLSSAVISATGQSFRVSVAIPQTALPKPQLIVFDATDHPRRVKVSSSDGSFLFTGKVQRPSYAELRFGSSLIIPFFIENADISVVPDCSSPLLSHISGSRSNSILRYQQEQCALLGADNAIALFLAQQPDDAVAPYLLY